MSLAMIDDIDIDSLLDLSMFEPIIPEVTAQSQPEKQIPKRRKRPSIKQSILALRRKHDELLLELQSLQSKAPVAITVSKWQERSIEQARFAKLALQENAKLRQLLEQHTQVSKKLQRMYSKIQRIHELSSPILEPLAALGMTKRQECLKGILQYQYNLLSSHWIRQDLHQYEDSYDNISQTKTKVVQAKPSMDYVKCTTYSINVAELSAIFWQMLDFRLKADDKADVLDRNFEAFDEDDIMYTRYVCHNQALAIAPLGVRVASRRFIEKDRVVIVWHTIVDDTLFPWNSNYWKNNASGWTVIQSQGQNKSRVISYIHLDVPTMHCDPQSFDVGNLMALMMKQFENDMAFCDKVLSSKVYK